MGKQSKKIIIFPGTLVRTWGTQPVDNRLRLQTMGLAEFPHHLCRIAMLPVHGVVH
jgi:hypothetical protein